MNDYYDYYDYYGYSSTPAAVSIIPTIISLVLCVFVLVCMWIIFRKANKPGWAAIVPFYNLYVMFEITWGSGWRFLLMLIPIYNIILSIQTQIRLAKAFGKGGGFAAGLIFLPYIFIPILAFSGASYQGIPVKAASYQPNQPNNPYQNNPYQNNPYQNNAYGNAPQGGYQQQPYQQPPYAAPQQPYQQPQQPQYTPPQQPQYTAAFNRIDNNQWNSGNEVPLQLLFAFYLITHGVYLLPLFRRRNSSASSPLGSCRADSSRASSIAWHIFLISSCRLSTKPA